MKPSDLSQNLRHIAAAIEKSKSPNPTLVARDIRKLLVALEGEVPSAPVEATPAPQAAPVEVAPALTPAAAAEAIQGIAAKLAASKNPDRALVIQDIKSVITALS